MTLDEVTDLDLQALLDGELDDRRAQWLLDAMEKSETLRMRYMAYARQRNLLKSWWKDN